MSTRKFPAGESPQAFPAAGGHFLLDKKMDMRNKIILAEKMDALPFIF